MTEEVKFHPAAEIFPLIVGDVLKEFVADIKAQGQLHPIVWLNGLILEGRNRHPGVHRTWNRTKIRRQD